MADEAKNVIISVLDHVETQLGPDTPISWPGDAFDTADVDEWIEPRVLAALGRPSRASERFESWTLNVNCYAKTGLDAGGNPRATIHRPWELTDLVRAAFDQIDVPVKNWGAAGDPVIAYLRFGEVSIVPIPSTGAQPRETPELAQLNVSVDGLLIF